MLLFIFGSRTITDRNWIFAQLDDFYKTIPEGEKIVVLEGEAQGVDLIAKEWALSKDLEVREYPADWKQYHYQAGFIRNEQMTVDCDFMLILWTGKSSGTFHDIMMAYKYKKPYKIFLYDADERLEGLINKALSENSEILAGKDIQKTFKKFKKIIGI